jgi:hypothetical protein
MKTCTSSVLGASNTLNEAANASLDPSRFSLGTYSPSPSHSSILTDCFLHSLARCPRLLMYHFFSVAFYAIWVMFTHPRTLAVPYPEDEAQLERSATPSDSGVEVEPSSAGVGLRKRVGKAGAKGDVGEGEGQEVAAEVVGTKPGISEYPALVVKSFMVVRLFITYLH